LYETQDKTFSHFKKGMFNKDVTSFNDFFESNMNSAIDQISQWEEPYQKYAHKLKI